jgi:RimJ/RimL family protein N-acetyltransferase
LIVHGRAVTLRPFDRCHAEQARQWANDPELARLLDRARPITDIEHERWFAAQHGRDDCVYFALESRAEEQHVGLIWLWDIDARHRKAEVRIVIGAGDGVGRGLGSEALCLLADYARARLNLRRLYAHVLGTNLRARRAFEKAGFAIEGLLRQDRWVDDRYADVWLLGKLLDACSNTLAESA